MTEIYQQQRTKLLNLSESFARLLPETPPPRSREPGMSLSSARQHLKSTANNYASLQIIIGWGSGSILEHIGADPILRQNKPSFLCSRAKNKTLQLHFTKIFYQLSATISRKCFMSAMRKKSLSSAIKNLPTTQTSHVSPVATLLPATPSTAKRANFANDSYPVFSAALAIARKATAMISPIVLPACIIALITRSALPAPTLGEIHNHFGDAPVISIGGGPSLSTHIATLRELQDKCVLIAADSTCPGLIKEGIEPHFVSPIERLPATVDLVQCLSGTRTWFSGGFVVPKEASRRF